MSVMFLTCYSWQSVGHLKIIKISLPNIKKKKIFIVNIRYIHRPTIKMFNILEWESHIFCRTAQRRHYSLIENDKHFNCVLLFENHLEKNFKIASTYICYQSGLSRKSYFSAKITVVKIVTLLRILCDYYTLSCLKGQNLFKEGTKSGI